MDDNRRVIYLERREYLRSRPLLLVHAQPVDLSKHPLLDTPEKRRAFLGAQTGSKNGGDQLRRSDAGYDNDAPVQEGV